MHDTFQHAGHTFAIELERDDYMGAPWDEHDGHGVVSEWTSRPKRPGELVLHSDRDSKRFYDLGATIQRAKAEGWGLGRDALAELAQRLGRAPTAGQIREAAVRADFERLRLWCADQWEWVGVIVTLLDDDGESLGDEFSASLWGIESDSPDYHLEVAAELAGDILHALAQRAA